MSDPVDRIVVQLAGERGRVVVGGRRTDDHNRCDLLIVHESGGTWALYPHGAARFGVRINAAAAAVVREILDGER